MQWLKSAIIFFSNLKKAKVTILFAAQKLGFVYAAVKHKFTKKWRQK